MPTLLRLLFPETVRAIEQEALRMAAERFEGMSVGILSTYEVARILKGWR